MTTLIELAKRVEKLLADNSPAILTGIGITGTLTTAYLTGTATFKAAEILREECTLSDDIHYPSIKVGAPLVWKLYIPPAATGLITIAAIIGANRIGTRRAAAIAAAYSLSERAFDEYKVKVIEKLGAKKEQTVRDEVAQDRVNKDPVTSREVLFTGNGEILCYEAFTGRYFTSEMELLRKAENNINREMLNDSYASLSDFYDEIGLPHTSISDDVGWTSDHELVLKFSTTLSTDGRPCMVIDYNVSPLRYHNRLL